ncbi:DUF2007 domain-containing protein [uncultured Paraglaciecola sp.]|uniref:putative signal transducing protein n=1 Tax=uncultured Paraglaciecola sp. TaxID=1765024 RepID=UPI0026159542|nr:DUF2007 domain-containing protein [uncultured Paraglaciecola sp.]
MERVYSHHDRFRIFQVKQLLEELGIPCFVKNEFAIGAIGELSPMDVMPEVWISDPEWLPKAQQFIADFQAQPLNVFPWICTTCNETNEANFELCWQCGQDNDK